MKSVSKFILLLIFLVLTGVAFGAFRLGAWYGYEIMRIELDEALIWKEYYAEECEYWAENYFDCHKEKQLLPEIEYIDRPVIIEKEIEKIWGKNLLRVMNEVEQYALSQNPEQ